MITGYLRLLIFVGLFLVALQLPSVFEQYQQRLTAQLTEIQRSLLPFKEVAKKSFNGDLNRLIEEYRTNKEPAFREQSQSVSDLYRQSLKLQAQVELLQAPWPQQLLQWQRHIKNPLLKETLQQLSYTGSLPQIVVVRVITCVFVVLLIAESLLRVFVFLLSYIFYVPRRVKR